MKEKVENEKMRNGSEVEVEKMEGAKESPMSAGTRSTGTKSLGGVSVGAKSKSVRPVSKAVSMAPKSMGGMSMGGKSMGGKSGLYESVYEERVKYDEEEPDGGEEDKVGREVERPWWRRWALFSWFWYEEAVALWDWSGKFPDELAKLERGRLVDIKRLHNVPGRRWPWAWVRIQGSGIQGFVPYSYLVQHKETITNPAYKEPWYLGRADVNMVSQRLAESHVALGTFAVCRLAQKGLNGLDEYVILVRQRSGDTPVPSDTETVSDMDSDTDSIDNSRDLVGRYTIERDKHLRYFINPARPCTTLYRLVTQLMMHRYYIPVELNKALGPEPGTDAVRLRVPAPPAHPTRIPVMDTPIHLMTPEEKHSLLRPFGVSSDDIQCLGHLGEGQFGEVKRGVWKRRLQGDEVPVAFKSLSSMRQDGSGAALGSRHEALIMARLDHVNVIAFYAYDKARKLIVMEFMNRGSLDNLLKGEAREAESEMLEPRRLVDMLYQVACGMEHIHEQGIVHRDLAARNCLLTDMVDGGGLRVKVGDLGLAIPVQMGDIPPSSAALHEFRSGSLTYPYKYLAPEVLRTKYFGRASDVWQFGMLIHEVWSLCGEVPYALVEYNTPPELLKWLEESPENRVGFAENMPPFIQDVQYHCHHLNPWDRPSFTDISARLLAILRAPAHLRFPAPTPLNPSDLKAFAPRSHSKSIQDSEGFENL